jgi:hypothetical protein
MNGWQSIDLLDIYTVSGQAVDTKAGHWTTTAASLQGARRLLRDGDMDRLPYWTDRPLALEMILVVM